MKNIPSLQPLSDLIPTLVANNLSPERFGDLARWYQALDKLPEITPSSININSDTITIGQASDCSDSTRELLREQLKNLHPWRKGPFNLFDVFIDTEWRSDWKWNRLKDVIAPLAGKVVLDVGCGSGYHCWRMRGAGAATVIGIEPTPLFIVQFQALQKYIGDCNVNILPARMEELPKKLQAFDSVFSMGILYHRRSPFEHLQELFDVLKPGGQLILETLVIDGHQGEVLVPEGRYSKMGNIWFIPSVGALEVWLKKMKFENVHHINTCQTSYEEQRSTEWMRFQSLKDFLDPMDINKTIEGYPAPKRAIFIATKPF
jgi:tRNA (mo5U34)-methyltransferase